MWDELEEKDWKKSELERTVEVYYWDRKIWECKCGLIKVKTGYIKVCICKNNPKLNSKLENVLSEIYNSTWTHHPENNIAHKHPFSSIVKQELYPLKIYMYEEVGLINKKRYIILEGKGRINANVDVRSDIKEIKKPRDLNIDINLGLINL